MPSPAFIVNPAGGGGRALAAWQGFNSRFPGHPVYFTQGAGDGTVQTDRAIADGHKRFVAVGGDGTVSEVAHALVGEGLELAVVPAGTGNDYARTLRLPASAEAFSLALEGSAKPVDVGECVGHRHFVNIAGAGFDAEVMTTFNSPGSLVRRLPVKARYHLSTLKTFTRFRGVRATVCTESERFEVESMLLLAVGCAQYYGAGMRILPDASLEDGLLDLVWGQDVSLAKLSQLMKLIYEGRHVGHPNVRFLRCREVTVEAAKPTRFHLDGDVTGCTPVTFRTVPSALLVVQP